MRILIVDDESLNRFLLVHMLEEAGYTDCYEAESGHEAIQLAKKIKPDLVLLDIVMPDMDGFDVAPKLKKIAGDIYLPIIFITSLDDHASLVRCLEVGGDDFASKPFDKIILTAKIRAHARTRLLSKKTFEQNRELTYYRNAVEREHAIVEHIFNNALAINERTQKYFEYRLAPASNFNGDMFLIEPSPAGGMYFLVGDFTGHGLASAIGALPVTRAFQAMAAKGLAVAEMASTINHTLLSLLPADMFFASAIVEISKTGNNITVWNGGMPDLLVIDRNGKIQKHYESMHMALGILDDDDFDDAVEHFEGQASDRLIAYSDGVIELTNLDEKMLGEQVLINWLTEEPDISVADLTQRIEKFKGQAEQADDITLVSYVCQPLDLRHDTIMTDLPFDITVEMNAERLRQMEPVHEVIMMICSQLGMETLRSDLSTVLSELFNNSLEHGLLKLDSSLKKTTDGFFEYFDQRMAKLEALEEGSIVIRVKYVPEDRMMELEVTDSGEGFDHQGLKAIDDQECYGRGIPLVRELCSEVSYSQGGKHVKAVFCF